MCTFDKGIFSDNWHRFTVYQTFELPFIFKNVIFISNCWHSAVPYISCDIYWWQQQKKTSKFSVYMQSLFLLKITVTKPFRQTQTLRNEQFSQERNRFVPRWTGQILSPARYIQTHFCEDQFNQFSVILQIVPPTNTDYIWTRRYTNLLT